MPNPKQSNDQTTTLPLPTYLIVNTQASQWETVKVVLVGDTNSGKSAFFWDFLRNPEQEKLSLPVGIDFRIIKIDSQQFQLWDAGGQEKSHKITDSHFKQTNLILCFGDTNSYGKSYLSEWVDKELDLFKSGWVMFTLQYPDNKTVQLGEKIEHSRDKDNLRINQSVSHADLFALINLGLGKSLLTIYQSVLKAATPKTEEHEDTSATQNFSCRII